MTKPIYHICEHKVDYILSPYYILKENPELFNSTSFKIYEQRAKNYYKKQDISHQEMIKFLDNYRKPLTSKSLFFSFLPYEDMPFISHKLAYEYKFDISTIKKYSIGKPILVFKKTFEVIPWDKLYDNYHSYVSNAMKGASKPIPKNGFHYTHMVHIAFNMEPLATKESMEIKKITTK